MKKYISILFTALIAMSLLTSCDKDSEGKTWVTYYPTLNIDGDKYMTWDPGVPFVDPGFTAQSDGQSIADLVQVDTDMDFADPKPGYYTILYSVANAEGNVATATRYVLVADPNDPVSGLYYTDPDSYREYAGSPVYFGNSYLIVVYNVEGDTYFVSDLIGGWYAQRAGGSGYGPNYAMQGLIKVEGNSVTMLNSYVPGWGDTATGMTEGTFDAATNTLSWVVEYTDYPFFFHVYMTK